VIAAMPNAATMPAASAGSGHCTRTFCRVREATKARSISRP
jgi:hypothetical protein